MAAEPLRSALTIRYGELRDELSSDAWICEGYDEVGPGELQPIFHAVAVWDTGATNCVISRDVVQRLGLPIRGDAQASHLGGSSLHDIHIVNVTLPNGISARGIEAICGPTPGCDVLVGMDIIGLGDLAVSNFQGETVLSFRTPSVAVTDYEGSL